MDIPPKVVERLNKATEEWRRARVQSSGASIGFHEKLAVLTAGSLVLAISGAGALYQKPTANSVAMHWLLYSLTASAVCLWLSLVASVVHNFCETYAINLDAEVDFVESELQIFDAVIGLTQEQRKDSVGDDAPIVARGKALIAQERDKSMKGPLKRAHRLRQCELRLSIAPILLFVLGYLSVLGYVIVLSRTV